MRLRYVLIGAAALLGLLVCLMIGAPEPKPAPAKVQGLVSMMSNSLAANPDMGTYSPRTVTYAPNNDDNILGDGSNPAGGIAPAFSTHPEPDESWDTVDTRWTSGPQQACTVTAASTTCFEKKFRTTVPASTFGRHDMIRYYGKPGVSHCHEFFGNTHPSAWSDRQSLRRRPESTAFGYTMQATAYWEPCWSKQINGKLYAMKAKSNVVYYTVNRNPTDPQVNNLQYLHTLLGFIGGVNMDDPNDCKVKNEIDKANGGSGTSCTITPGRYGYRYNGFLGYVCLNESTQVKAQVKGGGEYSKSFVLADGTDPWQGQCVDGMVIYAEGNAPQCWDGVNVMSPDGYSHFRYGINDNNRGSVDTCPQGWYRVPAFELKTLHPTRGWDDYKTWRLDSDAMMEAKLSALGTPRTVLPGESFHFDWKNGWNKIVLRTMLDYCLGIGAAPHECNNNTHSSTGSLDYPAGGPPFATVDPNNASTLALIGTVKAATIKMKGS